MSSTQSDLFEKSAVHHEALLAENGLELGLRYRLRHGVGDLGSGHIAGAGRASYTRCARAENSNLHHCAIGT